MAKVGPEIAVPQVPSIGRTLSTPPLHPGDLARGGSQSGVRLYNERLVLSLIRRYGSLPKAEIARVTGLSAQTASVIVKQLEADGLLLRQRPQRGRIGQPPVPLSLNPDGAYSIGLKVGRRSADLVLIDLMGKVRASQHRTYRYPEPGPTLDFVRDGIEELQRDLKPAQRARISGLGIATPFELWNWEKEIGAPHDVLQVWRTFDLVGEVTKLSGWPVQLCNDATAACAAELSFGIGSRYRDFVYFFIGSFIGGGIVLNGMLYQGRTANAGALGSMPVSGEGPLGVLQLIRSASLYRLEQLISNQGRDPSMLWKTPQDWGEIGNPLDVWIKDSSIHLAQAIVASVSVIDFEAAIIDVACPPDVRTRLVEETKKQIAQLDQQGLSPFTTVEGSIGSDARAIGGASLPLLTNFAVDREIFLRTAG
ncbi:ROK family transcriptional regulator [Dongia deserti]|uniref:ROK family transcriptional regulator n=1 Tax=Dongia deserti TaxID=2268030 RepID=UPI000E65EB05|nr:ROK family transcriptional regulator [Dongia deserti]